MSVCSEMMIGGFLRILGREKEDGDVSDLTAEQDVEVVIGREDQRVGLQRPAVQADIFPNFEDFDSALIL